MVRLHYKFPGGGIEKGESIKDAVIREMLEEAELKIIPQSIKEFGYVHRIQKSDYPKTGYWIQDNYYYLCDVEDCIGAQDLDDYEKEEKFTLEYVNPDKAIFINRILNHGANNQNTFEHEARALEILKEEGYFNLYSST